MAWLFGDGMGHYTAKADIAKKWTTYYEPSGTVIQVGAYGRFGRSGLRLGVTGITGWARGYLSRVLAPADPTTVYAGIGLRLTDRLASSFPTPLFEFFDASVTQCGLRINLNGTLSAMRGDSKDGTVLGTTAQALSLDVDYFVEVGFTIHNSAGVYGVRVNGASWLSGTGADTQATGAASWNEVRLTTPAGYTVDYPAYVRYSDFYVVDGSGSRLNTFLGDLRGDCHYVTEDGAVIQWTPLAGQNHEAVDETGTFDGDTSYNHSTTVDQVDTFQFEDLKNAGATAIHAVQVLVAAEQATAGAGKLKAVARVNGTNYPSAQEFAPSAGSYAWHNGVYEQNPDGTPAPWTEASLNGAEFGYKKTA